jgi:sulfonate transport system permease protein
MDAEQLSRPDIIIVGILSIGLLGYAIDHIFICIINFYGKGVKHGGADNKESVQDFSYK